MVGVATRLKRHPLPVAAHFDFSLVLTYAFPSNLLGPLLPPGLVLDEYAGHGFLAIALVATRELRPAFLPRILGQRFFLSGCRIFSRFRTRSGRALRGLRILRSDADSPLMVRAGNLLTHYNYRLAQVEHEETAEQLRVRIRSEDGCADLSVSARISEAAAPLPVGSPFPDLRTARLFAGPLPFTFDYERETHSVVRIEGVRRHWTPHPVAVEVEEATFLRQSPFCEVEPCLANAFLVRDVPYMWKRGIREVLPPP